MALVMCASSVWTPSFSGARRHPARSFLDCAEHGNPVARHGVFRGGLVVRLADGRGGNRMVQEAKAGGPKGHGKRRVWSAPPSGCPWITSRIPERSGPEREPT